MTRSSSHVVAVIRHRARVLACRDEAGTGAVVLPTAALGDDPRAALRGLLDALGNPPNVVERRGPVVETDDATLVPFLVSLEASAVTDSEGCRRPGWETPARLLEADDDRWWRAHTAVAPTVETVKDDAHRGSTAIAIDALWVLRDAATRVAMGDDGMTTVKAVANALLAARPAMAALGNRVNGVMARARSPEAVERAATAGIDQAVEADDMAAQLAAETVGGGRVLTLSRSGTVRDAVLVARPTVEVLASRPGGEGLGFAESLVEAGLTASTLADADVYTRLRSGEINAVLVGADAITPDGGVVNKVGTRATALAAEWAEVPCYVVCATDKIRPMLDDGSDRPLDSDPPLESLFDWTPPRLVSALLTERGRIEPTEVPAIAEELRALTRWQTSVAP